MGMLPRSKAMVRFKCPIGGTPSANLASLGIAMVPRGPPSLSVIVRREKPADRGGNARKRPADIAKVYGLFPILAEKRRNPALVSGGQQQMVAIGRALVANPELILSHEISLGLAPIVVNDVYAAMPEILTSGISAVIVQQDIERARRVSQTLVCLRRRSASLCKAHRPT